ncbi:HET-domain-containing protein, partial [Lojkania enalia]
AIRWLDLCRRTHVTCNRVHSSVNRPPTRLIDIGPEGTLLLRLVYPQEPVEYLTLSHCWGKSHIICLLKANHEQLLRSIKQEHLPQLFKDAVSVTQRLGYRYLWIDSLCIIQDSPEDWESEASRMGSVYENSVCTIAAVSAPDSNSSLFTRYYPLYTNNYIMRDVTRGVRKIVTNLLERPEPLYKRAWALQERLVSPRLIEYGKNGISWHCREEIFLEPGIPVTHLSPLAESWNNLLCTHIGEDQTEGVRANIDPLINGQRGWMKLVGEYSEMKLTFESDRVHALKGVISVLQARRGLSFLAGVCQNFLPYSLLW